MTADARVTAWLDRLEGLHTAATPGPWFWTTNEHWKTPVVCEAHWPGLSEEEAEEYGEVPGPPHHVVAQMMFGGRRETDAAAIVAEHNALPALLALARGVAALAEELEAEAARLVPMTSTLTRTTHRVKRENAARLRRLLADAAPDTGEETA